jgi:hypothetical protein
LLIVQVRVRASQKTLSLFTVILAICLGMGCSSVSVLRLTSDTFPPRSVEEVAILSEAPPIEHIRIAELSETSSSRVDTLQRHILKKAAQLGADAVIFSVPHTRSEQRVDYQPMYSPWGYYAPYYYGPGPYGYSRTWGYSYGGYGAFVPFGGYQRYAAVPYSVRVTSLKGVAIRYGRSPGAPAP